MHSVFKRFKLFFGQSIFYRSISHLRPTDLTVGADSVRQFTHNLHLPTSRLNIRCTRRWQRRMAWSSRPKQFTCFKTTLVRFVTGGSFSSTLFLLNFIAFSAEHVTRICHRHVSLVQWTLARLLDVGESKPTAEAVVEQSTFKQQHTKPYDTYRK